MKNNKQLINNIVGQLNGISKMMEAEKNCREVLTQLKAVKSATNSLMIKYIEENAFTCLGDKSSVKINDKKKIKELFSELIKNN